MCECRVYGVVRATEYVIYMKCKLRLFKSTFLQWSSRAIKPAMHSNGAKGTHGPHTLYSSRATIAESRLCSLRPMYADTVETRPHSHKIKIILFLAARTTNHWMGLNVCGWAQLFVVVVGQEWHTIRVPLTNHLVLRTPFAEMNARDGRCK